MHLLSCKQPALAKVGNASAVLRGSALLAIRLRSDQSIVQDVHIADKREYESVVKSQMVGNDSLNYREDRPAHDRHIQDAGTASAQGAEFRFTQAEDCRKHN